MPHMYIIQNIHTCVLGPHPRGDHYLSLKKICSQVIFAQFNTIFHPSGMVKGVMSVAHPYFVKRLEASTTDDIDLRICYFLDENFVIELIAIFPVNFTLHVHLILL